MIRIADELSGIPCLTDRTKPVCKKSITCSRSFSSPIYEVERLEESVMTYIARAAARMRREGAAARGLYIYAHSKKPKVYTGGYGSPSKGFYEKILLPHHTNDTVQFIKAASKVIKKVFIPGVRYKKSGVVLYDILPDDCLTFPMFDTQASIKRRSSTLKSIDRINNRFGEGRIRIASEGLERSWSMKREHLSPRYTTSWNELLIVS